MNTSTSRLTSRSRKAELQAFGAVCALMVIEGQTLEPIDPCILQYMIHGMDLHSLHEDLIGAWHPTLRSVIKRWQQTGPEGDVRFAVSILGSYSEHRGISISG